MSEFKLPFLPPKYDFETITILKKCIKANMALSELKGVCKIIPNQNILINTLVLQEAKDSSAVENIITTHDEIFKEVINSDQTTNIAAKEVENYSFALKKGFNLIKSKNLITTSTMLEIQEILEKNKAGFRRLPGTKLESSSGEIVYTPPQNYFEIIELIKNLEIFINDESILDIDPLIKMAIIHYQFESIHPFYDGNGRTGRIINILYLIQQNLLEIPILYLSRYIIRNKSTYYKLLQDVRINNNWSDWVYFILDGIESISLETINLIYEIRDLMFDYKEKIRTNHKKIYSQDLLNNIFSHPYTKIEFLENDLQISRVTASKYLEELVEGGLLLKEKFGRSNFYINVPLYTLLKSV